MARAVCILLFSMIFLPAWGKLVTISNVVPRLDTNGAIVNAHDGGVYQWDGFKHEFFMYGTVYEDCHQNNSQCQSPCGYNPNRFALYVSNDLETWELYNDNILPEVSRDNNVVNYWMPNVGRHPKSGIFYMNFWSTHCGFSVSCTELAVSVSPYGPFKMLQPIPVSYTPSSQMGLFVDGDQAYIKFNTVPEQHHAIQQLSPDWNTSVGVAWPIFWKASFPWNEGGGMFKRGNLYYYMTGSDCCFCQWGGDAKVWTAYHPLGPWHPGMAPVPSDTVCDLTGTWLCHDGVNRDGKCLQNTIQIVQQGGTFTFGENSGTVLANGYVLASVSPNKQPGVVTSADGKSSGCDRIRWYGDETAHWCRTGKECATPSSYLDPLEVNFCKDGSLPQEGIRVNPCSPKNPLLGQNFTVPAQQFNVIQLQLGSNITWIYYGERSMSATDLLKSHNFQAWVPLTFGKNGEILPLSFPDSFTLEV